MPDFGDDFGDSLKRFSSMFLRELFHQWLRDSQRNGYQYETIGGEDFDVKLFDDDAQREIFEQKLREAGIEFTEKSVPAVRFNTKDRKAIEKIYQEVIKGIDTGTYTPNKKEAEFAASQPADAQTQYDLSRLADNGLIPKEELAALGRNYTMGNAMKMLDGHKEAKEQFLKEKKALKAEQKAQKRELAARQKASRKKSQSLKAQLKQRDKELSDVMCKTVEKRRKANNAVSWLGYNAMYIDGICEVEEGLFSETIAFEDTSYQSTRDDIQKGIFASLCRLYDQFGADNLVQMSVINTPILTRGNGTSNAYTVIAGLKTSVIIVGQSILAFALLMQLVKISQRVDANGTMPVVKEILILAVFFFIGSYLVNHSFDICTAAYDEINKLISEVTSNNNRQTIGGIVLGDTTSVDEGAMLGIVIAIMIMWLFSFLGSIVGIALIMARAIQLYVMAACSPIPFSLLLFDETRQMGIGFCKSFLSVCLAGLILAVLMMIYPALIGDVLQAAASPDGTGKYTLDITNYWKASIPIVACSFMYLYALLKSGAWARDILGG